MTPGTCRTLALAGLACLLAACATPGTQTVREDLVYFENPDGKHEKFATILNRSPDGESVFFIRARDGTSIAVCTGHPGDTNETPVATGMPGPTLVDSAPELLRVAFFQNCIARANGFIDEQGFLRAHRALINAVSRNLGRVESQSKIRGKR